MDSSGIQGVGMDKVGSPNKSWLGILIISEKISIPRFSNSLVVFFDFTAAEEILSG